MSDTITQTRLSLRLDAYKDVYQGKHAIKDLLSRAAWDTAWKVANDARANSTLTPEIVDDVRIALNKS